MSAFVRQKEMMAEREESGDDDPSQTSVKRELAWTH